MQCNSKNTICTIYKKFHVSYALHCGITVSINPPVVFRSNLTDLLLSSLITFVFYIWLHRGSMISSTVDIWTYEIADHHIHWILGVLVNFVTPMVFPVKQTNTQCTHTNLMRFPLLCALFWSLIKKVSSELSSKQTFPIRVLHLIKTKIIDQIQHLLTNNLQHCINTLWITTTYQKYTDNLYF